MTVENKIKIAIDRGGTFTDVIAIIPHEPDYVFKLLSVDPSNYKDANIEGIRRVLEYVQGTKIPKGQLLDTSCISSIRLGTTVATNALLERKGSKTAFLVTKGFKDILHIGDQTRPDLFALSVEKPAPLYESVIEINERVTIPSATEDPETLDYSANVDGKSWFQGESKDIFQVLQPLDEQDSLEKLNQLKTQGIESIAICLIHGYSFQNHERQLKTLAERVGFKNISVSHELIPMISAIPRAQSTVVDAYLTPVIQEYIDNFLNGFNSDVEHHTRIEFMQSDGGLCSWRNFSALKSLLSGPAGGVVGEAETCYDEDEKTPIVGFDMGGTSTDVSRYHGNYEISFRSVTAGVHIAAPQLDINTVAAGGGSILTYKHGVFKVGPDSAGAHPGPACYRKGGPLTITDANLMCGRILPEFFPKIFGPTEDQSLDFDVVKLKFSELTKVINQESDKQFTPYEVALGFLKVANFQMAKPISILTESKGYDVTTHHLASFGGAGGQHATSIASILKMKKVVIHKYSSILSAYGIALADIVQEDQKPFRTHYNDISRDKLLKECYQLVTKVTDKLLDQGVDSHTIKAEIFFNMGYDGSDTTLMISRPEDDDFHSLFTSTHERQFSFIDKERGLVVHDIRVRASGNVSKIKEISPHKDYESIKKQGRLQEVLDGEIKTTKIHFEQGVMDSKVYKLTELPIGGQIKGPALILDATQTILVTPSATATIINRHVLIDLEDGESQQYSNKYIDPILLSVFANRFTSIAEDMGRTLQKISVSPNIKERLDFSCALFDDEGNLVANAPHVPVHLGSMSNSIRYAKKYWGEDIKPGDVLATNHPAAGGTHLPDITLISPVFMDGKIVFFTASRAHHAEIGGSVPGSCSAAAKFLWEEGAQFEAFRIVRNGKFDYESVNKYFVEEPAKYPGCSGSRRLKDNVSDLHAQIASNQRGVNLLMDLFNEYGSEIVLFYMKGIEDSAEVAVRKFLKTVAIEKKHQLPLKAEEVLDDGSIIRVSIDINEHDGSAIYDFSGTTEEAYNCGNAPIAITYACVIYCLRLMINSDIPLNEGCLNPVKLIIPKGSILNPSPNAAVSAANSATSQRLTDTILKAYEIAGASSGSNNTLGFGKGGKDADGVMKQGFAMVETIGAGIGAIDGKHGFSGAHCHMTNTKITDPEILELRYPIVLHEFSVRLGSGGKGKYNGGDGLVRVYEFTSSLSCTLRTQRRVNRPYGMKGGKEGKVGKNRLGKRTAEGIQWILLPSFSQFMVEANDLVKIITPGGGGFGEGESEPIELNNGSRHIPIAGGTVASIMDLTNTSQ